MALLHLTVLINKKWRPATRFREYSLENSDSCLPYQLIRITKMARIHLTVLIKIIKDGVLSRVSEDIAG
jgi:hypothetical protein